MREVVYIAYLNNHGSPEYWPFISYVDHMISVEETGETKKNILPSWPKSYDANASTIRKQTFRRTRKQKVIRTQFLSREQALEVMEGIKSSIDVQLQPANRRPGRTVIVDSDSIVIVKGSDRIHNATMTITYTDDYPTQHS